MFLKSRKNKETNSSNKLQESSPSDLESSLDGNHTDSLTSIINSSPQVTKGANTQAMIDQSPKMVAQRKKNEQLFGNSFSKDSSPIQTKENKTGLPDNLKTGVENLSGQSLDDVKVHYNSSKPKEINSLAYAQGNEIHVGAGQEKHLPHEAWHVVQQKQGKVKPTIQAKSVAINNDTALEKEADVMGEASLKNKKEQVQLNYASLAPKNVIQRYEIEGPWDKNDPVHENITLYSLMEAGLAKPDSKQDDASVFEYTRGVIFNDDPEGLLFDNNEKENHNWSSGAEWYDHFKGGEKKAKKNETIGVNNNLTERSHYGDLQFLHGMAGDGELASITKDKIMMWAEFCYKVAISQIPDSTKIKDVPVPGIPQLFPSNNLKDITIRQFFHVNASGSTEQRAIGSLLHMVQDSFAEGHVEREDLGNNKKGDVVSFHSYTHQDHKKHGEKDAFHDGKTIRDKIHNIPGGDDAVINGAVLLLYFKDKDPWESVKFYLDNYIFKLKDPNKAADSGKAFEKK
jgi:hypothetical protein